MGRVRTFGFNWFLWSVWSNKIKNRE